MEVHYSQCGESQGQRILKLAKENQLIMYMVSSRKLTVAFHQK